VESVVDKAALGQVFSEYFGFLCQSSSTDFFIIIIITRRWHNRPVVVRSAEWTQLDYISTIPIKKIKESSLQFYIYIVHTVHVFNLLKLIYLICVHRQISITSYRGRLRYDDVHSLAKGPQNESLFQ
jgi:hypothetical protein